MCRFIAAVQTLCLHTIFFNMALSGKWVQKKEEYPKKNLMYECAKMAFHRDRKLSLILQFSSPGKRETNSRGCSNFPTDSPGVSIDITRRLHLKRLGSECWEAQKSTKEDVHKTERQREKKNNLHEAVVPKMNCKSFIIKVVGFIFYLSSRTPRSVYKCLYHQYSPHFSHPPSLYLTFISELYEGI